MISCTASVASATIGPWLLPVSMLVMPSICTLFWFARMPLALIVFDCAPRAPGADVAVFTIPAELNASPKKLRPFCAMLCTASPSIANDRSALLACSSVVRAATMTVSSRPPISIVSVPNVFLSPALTCTSGTSRVLNPAIVTVSLYLSAGTIGKTK